MHCKSFEWKKQSLKRIYSNIKRFSSRLQKQWIIVLVQVSIGQNNQVYCKKSFPKGTQSGNQNDVLKS